MKWYITLTPMQKIALKEMYSRITGIDFVTAGLLFTFRERMDLVEQKLRLEGFAIQRTVLN